ncbi:MAG: tetrameric acyl-CoA thioesterase, partial [Desulfatiglandales bacterium]
DKSAKIEFLSPGKSTLYAEFFLDQKTIEEIKLKTANGTVYYPQFQIEIRDIRGSIVARVHKILYVRKR